MSITSLRTRSAVPPRCKRRNGNGFSGAVGGASRRAAAAAPPSADKPLDPKSSLPEDPRVLEGMSPRQEVWNALSMLVPSLVVLLLWVYPPTSSYRGPRTALILLGTAFHMPMSFLYHSLLAMRALPDAVDNVPRKLDQTFIHLTCVMTLWALSTSYVYIALGTALNVFFAARLWSPTSTLAERMINIGAGVWLYSWPVLLRGFHVEYAVGAAWLFTGAGAMVLRCGGWGHGIMHVCTGGLAYHFSLCAGYLQA